MFALNQDEIFNQCDWCNKPILYGGAYVTVFRSIEQANLVPVEELEARENSFVVNTIEELSPEVTVIDCDELLTLCPSCGNHLSGDLLRTFLGSRELVKEALRLAYEMKEHDCH